MKREELVALRGERWVLLDDALDSYYAYKATPARPEMRNIKFYCKLGFRLCHARDRQPDWHTVPPKLTHAHGKYPLDKHAWYEDIGMFYPYAGYFISLERPDTSHVLEFRVLKRRLSMLLLSGERGLLDHGESLGLYWGKLMHVSEQDLATLGLHDEQF